MEDCLGEEEGLEPLYINANNNGYEPGQCGTTLTAGELIEILSDYDQNRSVYLRFDNGYTYGSLIDDDVIEEEEE